MKKPLNRLSVKEIFSVYRLLREERLKRDSLERYKSIEDAPEFMRSSLEEEKRELREMRKRIASFLGDELLEKEIKDIYEKISSSVKEDRYEHVFFFDLFLMKRFFKKRASNTKEIEEAVVEYFQKKYPRHVLKKEFTTTDLPTRVDIFAVNPDEHDEAVISVEIKGATDTFERLYKQVSEYMLFSDIVYVAIDARHLKKLLNSFLRGFKFYDLGVLVYFNGKLHLFQEPRELPSKSYLSYLWGKELKRFLAPFRGRSKIPQTKEAYIDAIKALYTGMEIEEISKRFFLDRFREKKSEIPKIDMERKRKIFDVLAKRPVWKEYDSLDREKFLAAVKAAG